MLASRGSLWEYRREETHLCIEIQLYSPMENPVYSFLDARHQRQRARRCWPRMDLCGNTGGGTHPWVNPIRIPFQVFFSADAQLERQQVLTGFTRSTRPPPYRR